MLFNPYRHRLPTLYGTNIVDVEEFSKFCPYNIVGHSFEDTLEPTRRWTVHRLYCGSAQSRELRLRVEDDQGFISFITQMDFEVLTGLGKPGHRCEWASTEYPYPNDAESGWIGLYACVHDFDDDLHERELLTRQALLGTSINLHNPRPPITEALPAGLSLVRLLHADDADFKQLDVFLWDTDPKDTGTSSPTRGLPDIRRSTLRQRWSTVEKERIEWARPQTWT